MPSTEVRRCPRCKQDLPNSGFTTGFWCLECKKKYWNENQDMILERKARMQAALSGAAEAEGRCAWRDGRCPTPPLPDNVYCRTHAYMDSVRRSHDYLTPLRKQGFKL